MSYTSVRLLNRVAKGLERLRLGEASASVSNSSFSTSASKRQDDQIAEKEERVFFKEQPIVGGFKLFDPYMKKKKIEIQRVRRKHVRVEKDTLARYNKMSVDQDWTNVWPTKAMFKQSSVPLPVRQGHVRNMAENAGLPPEKYANAELVKIPNMLHLTPPHIKKQCAAIKKFCTPWPKELQTDEDCRRHFPIEISHTTYLYDGPTLRDDRARIVTIQVPVKSLNLSERESHKLITLAGPSRYDKASDLLTIKADRCPYRRQNEDHAMYMLTTLYLEAKQIEDWEEAEITEDDRLKYDWETSKSHTNIMKTVEQMPSNVAATPNDLNEYKTSVTQVFDEGESAANLAAYKQSVLNLLKMKNTAK